MSATHVVVRAFPGPGDVMLEPGTTVDASAWRNTHKLVEQRRLRPLSDAEPARERPAPAPSRGRSSKKGA